MKFIKVKMTNDKELLIVVSEIVAVVEIQFKKSTRTGSAVLYKNGERDWLNTTFIEMVKLLED